MKLVKISELTPNPDNPRKITKDKLEKLIKSVKDFPEMMKLRPLIVDENNVILGGNMRYQACKALGINKVEVTVATGLTEDQKREFILKDNVAYGEWDWEILEQNWETDSLKEWGLDIEFGIEEENPYSKKIESPHYQITGEKPALQELYDKTKVAELEKEINKAKIPTEIKEFLSLAATRHTKFNFSKIAEFYAHAPKEVQILMEQSALVIIDFNDAIKNGFVELNKEILENYVNDSGQD